MNQAGAHLENHVPDQLPLLALEADRLAHRSRDEQLDVLEVDDEQLLEY